MKIIFKIITSISFSFIFFQYALCQINVAPQVNILYGDKYVFTMETPKNWINDYLFAYKVGLESFFYSNSDLKKVQKSYFYAKGVDKSESSESLNKFIKKDIDNFKKIKSDLKYKSIKANFSDDIKNSKIYMFSNLPGYYMKEKVYLETDKAFIIFCFSARTMQNYKDYKPIFNKFIDSFSYLGDDPNLFKNEINYYSIM